MICSRKEMLAFAVLQRALGNGPYVKWGTESSSLLNKAVAKSVGDYPFGVSAFNSPYSDSGMFGIFVIAPAKAAGNVVRSAVQVLKSGSVTEKDVQRGKNQLKLHALLSMENGESAIEWIGKQMIFTNAALKPKDLAAEIDSVQAADVKKVCIYVFIYKTSMK